MDFSNKTIDFLGDSITYGHGLEDFSCRFSEILKRRLNLKESCNYGISGTRIACQLRPKPECSEDMLDFSARVEGMNSQADAVVVFGGVNDYQHGDAPMGDFSDRTADSFCGALNVLYGKLKQKFPNAIIVVITPLHMLDDTKKGGRYPEIKEPLVLSDYVAEIKKAANFYNLPVLDLFSCEELNPNNPKVKECYMPDGIHPNSQGHKILADLIEEFLNEL